LKSAIVGIGASAGGLVAVSEILAGLPSDPGMALIVVQHLDRAREACCQRFWGGARSCRSSKRATE
jgi:Chemotaxis response regulator containing a CheY-like receiver domain and a methylesterase domain